MSLFREKDYRILHDGESYRVQYRERGLAKIAGWMPIDGLMGFCASLSDAQQRIHDDREYNARMREFEKKPKPKWRQVWP